MGGNLAAYPASVEEDQNEVKRDHRRSPCPWVAWMVPQRRYCICVRCMAIEELGDISVTASHPTNSRIDAAAGTCPCFQRLKLSLGLKSFDMGGGVTLKKGFFGTEGPAAG
jgi:hypothetical protein